MDKGIALFSKMIEENRYDFEKLVYIIFPFGEPGHELEHQAPYDWQMRELRKLSLHLSNPKTRYDLYRLIISSGNGAAKTSFASMVMIMLMYTQRLRGRVTANTDPQLKTVVWPEIDKWFRCARYNEFFFEKFGTSIKSKNPSLADTWRFDTFTWHEQSPSAVSGLHNKGGAVMYWFEEAPGIPAVIWDYAAGAFTETETIKVWFAMGNSDDPESKFEQNMKSPMWNALRIDTRTLPYIDKNIIADWLAACGGNEDHDDFRVRVRGLPRKSAKDAIIGEELVLNALNRAKGFDQKSVNWLPCILTCDPAWTGGDETVIWYRQGNYACLLERYRLNKEMGQDHMFTYQRLVHWEREIKADAVFIDQGEGTGIWTIANNHGKSWELVSFASTANDAAEFQGSQYGNLRAQMYFEAAQFLQRGGILDMKDPEWRGDILKQLCWTKGTRHKIHGKKMAEAKLDIKKRVGQSPDIADGFVMTFARPVTERLPENDRYADDNGLRTGDQPYKMPEHPDPYTEVEFNEIYD